MSLLSFLKNFKYRPGQPQVGRGVYSFSGGTRINPDTAMEIAAFYSGVIYLSTQIGKLPWLIKDSKHKVVENHFSTKMLSLSPHPQVNSFFFRLFLMQSALVHGNGYAEIERDRAGRALRMHPIPPQYVDPFRTEDGELIYRIIGGDIQGRGDAWIPYRDMFHIKNFHTKDAFLGMGIVDYGREVLGVAKGADKFANATFENGAMPSGILTTDNQLGEEAMKRLQESWNENHKGRKVGNTAILEEGLKYQAISHSPEALQMIESRKFSVLEIARFLRIPPTKLYDITAATFDNQENSNLEVVTDTIDPWAVNWELETTVKILSNGHGGLRCELDLFQAFRADSASRSNFYKDLFGLGALSPNEIRNMENKPSIDNGEKYFIATNNYSPLDKVDDIVDSQINKSDSEQDMTEMVARYLAKKRN